MKVTYDFRNAVEKFVMRCEALVQEQWPAAKLSVTEGKRWWRIVKEEGDNRSMFCFVDATGDSPKGEHSGDVRRNDGWKKPAKLTTHLGNIYGDRGGMACVTEHGPQPRLAKELMQLGAEMIFDEALKALSSDYVVGDDGMIRRR